MADGHLRRRGMAPSAFTAFYTLEFCPDRRVWRLVGEVRNTANDDAVAITTEGPHVGLLLQRYALEAERAAFLLAAREEKCSKS